MTASHPLPDWAQTALAHPPRAGEGVNTWLFRMARRLRGWQDDSEIARMLAAAVANCGRRVTQAEILRAVHRAPTTRRHGAALPQSIPPAAPVAPERRWPAAEWGRIASVADRGTVETLRSESPFPLDRITAADLLRGMWEDDALVCVARGAPRDALTRPLRDWLADGVEQNALIVPSAMTAPTGRNQDGRTATRCLDNTGPRQWLVVEFDFAPDGPAADLLRNRTSQDLCAALLLHLRDRGAPLSMAVSSGGKSVHGWFPTDGQDDDHLKPFFATACRLGADPAVWTRCQLVRLPGGTRDNGKSQSVLYLDPRRLPHPEAMRQSALAHLSLSDARELYSEFIPF